MKDRDFFLEKFPQASTYEAVIEAQEKISAKETEIEHLESEINNLSDKISNAESTLADIEIRIELKEAKKEEAIKQRKLIQNLKGQKQSVSDELPIKVKAMNILNSRYDSTLSDAEFDRKNKVFSHLQELIKKNNEKVIDSIDIIEEVMDFIIYIDQLEGHRPGDVWELRAQLFPSLAKDLKAIINKETYFFKRRR